MHAFGTKQWFVTMREGHPDTAGGKAHHLASGTGQDTVRLQSAQEEMVVHDLKAFANAIASTAEHLFTSGQTAHKAEDLEAIAPSTEQRRTVEIAELG